VRVSASSAAPCSGRRCPRGEFDVVLVLTDQLLPLSAVEHLPRRDRQPEDRSNRAPVAAPVSFARAPAHVARHAPRARRALEHTGASGIVDAVIAVGPFSLLDHAPSPALLDANSWSGGLMPPDG